MKIDPVPDSDADHGVGRSDARATNSAQHRKDYKARVPIYPKMVHGSFRRLKWIVMALTLGIYYLVPWIRWNRGLGYRPTRPCWSIWRM